jgi:hypothetical protein
VAPVPHFTRRSWIVGVAGVLGLAALGYTIAGAQSEDDPVGTDPLSASEADAALASITSSGGPESGGLEDDDVVLLVERHMEAKADEDAGLRRADVYVYSYDDDVLTYSLVDLADNSVVETDDLTGTQLPLVEEEIDRATQIAMADPRFVSRLEQEFQRATGRAMGDVQEDVVIQPIVFLAESMPGRATGALAECGDHRCAQLMLQSSDNILINLLPVVDLSADRVLSREGFFSS